METWEYVKSIVAKIPTTISNLIWKDNGGGTSTATLSCGQFHYLRKNAVLTGGAIVTSVTSNTITINSSTGPTSIDMPSIKFYHGTAIQTNSEIHNIMDAKKKTPMIYLAEPYSEGQVGGDSVFDKEVELMLFFLLDADYTNWTTNTHYQRAIVQMENLKKAFIKVYTEDLRFGTYGKIFESTSHPRVNFGATLDKRGNEKKYFDDDLSGKDLQFLFQLKKGKQCCG